MSVIKAKNNYIGQGGCVRMNCAQSVVSAFKDKFNLDDELVESFRAFGGGRAPAGVCGAYYAVKSIIERVDKDKADELKKYFLDHAGALECSNIRGLKKLSCVGCVEKSSEFLENIG
ncbi:MAG: C-GCAxxG-C-C family (seleno)protein [Bacillota bacterium]|nr:C-GCAxxG-C-C family (seleno)protein [Bacillota bacterium]